MVKEIYFDDIEVGSEMPDLVKEPINEIQLARYAGASGDFNPIHYSQKAAEEAGLGGIIAHGMLIMGITAQALSDWIPQPRIKRFKVRFAGITRPGDVISVSGKVTEKKAADDENLVSGEIKAQNQKGEVKLSGSFTASLPRRA